MKTLGIYIHVPFCVQKCRYCGFYSVSCDRGLMNEYVSAVCRNIRRYADPARSIDTVYFGGGTPSLLDNLQFDTVLSEIYRCFRLEADAEITLEANPHTLFFDKLCKLRKTGINRLSLGVQSMKDDELKFLGRLHNAECAERAVLAAASAGFDNISCDLMLALPGQSPERLAYSIERLTSLPIRHISAYILKIEPGTPFDCNEIKAAIPDEDVAADLYLSMAEMLCERGFFQYEVSNFAENGYESRHNQRYWRCEEYIGIGPSAHSCYGGKRFAVESDLEKFISSPVQPIYITDESPCGFEEYAMLRLRLREGLDLRNTGKHRQMLEKKLPPLMESGYVNFDGNVISLTSKGFLMSNSVIGYLVF